MLKAIIILSFVAGAICVMVPVDLQQQMDGRILYGNNAKISDYPYIVSVQRFGYHICAGTIFRNDLIITAAQCLQRVTPTSMRVRAGSAEWNSGGSLAYVLTYKIHERYNPDTMENDIAIIRLSQQLNFMPNITSISLALYPFNVSGVGSVAGWGATTSNAMSLATTLQSTSMTILSQSDCASSKYGYGVNIRDSMVCGLSQMVAGPCDGDVGAPLVSGNKLVGIYSWGYDCYSTYYPSVYTDVTSLSFWLLKTAKYI